MKKGYFKTILGKHYEKFKDQSVFQVALGYLVYVAPTYGNIFTSAVDVKVKKLSDLSKKEVEAQYRYLLFEIGEIEAIFKSDFPHQSIVALKIKDSDKQYDFHQFWELGSIAKYPEFASFFFFLAELKMNFTEKQLNHQGTQVEFFELLREYLRAPDEADLEPIQKMEGCWTGEELIERLFSLLSCFGVLKELLKRYKIKEKELLTNNPSLINVKIRGRKKADNENINVREKALEKIPDEWKNRKVVDYFYLLFEKTYPKEVVFYEKAISLKIKGLKKDFRRASRIEKKHLFENRILEIIEELNLDKNKPTWNYFHTTVIEYFADFQDKIDFTFLAQQMDESFINDKERRNNKSFLALSSLMDEAFDDLEPSQFANIKKSSSSDNSKPFSETLSYLGKSVFTPKIKQFFVVKSLVEEKRFLEDVLDINKTVESELIDKKSEAGEEEQKKWYEDNTPFKLPDGYIKIDLGMTAIQERRFFSFLCLEKNKSEKNFLTVESSGEIFTYGFAIPNIPLKKHYKLDLNSHKRSKKVIASCFSKLYSNQRLFLFIHREVKEELAIFLKYYFEEFKDMNIGSIKNIMKNYEERKKSIIRFDVKEYLPNYPPKNEKKLGIK